MSELLWINIVLSVSVDRTAKNQFCRCQSQTFFVNNVVGQAAFQGLLERTRGEKGKKPRDDHQKKLKTVTAKKGKYLKITINALLQNTEEIKDRGIGKNRRRSWAEY